jgi:chitodextrinase
MFPVLVPDGNHGAIISWGDQRMGAGGLYAQGIDAAGLARWTSNGVPVTFSPFDDANTRIISDGKGGAIITWQDARLVDNSDIYASRLSPPVANAGGPYHGIAGVPVSLDGLGSIDPGGNPLTYDWDFGDGSNGSGAQPTHVYATNGQYTVVLTVSDTVLWDSAATTVTIASPLDCSGATAIPAVLWPPNHHFVPVKIEGIVHPAGQPVSIAITRVTQNEPGTGDAIVLSDGAVALRAERDGSGTGRLYTIWYSATTGPGASCDGSVQVCVPRDESHTDCAGWRR